jgi:hypothetical protein
MLNIHAKVRHLFLGAVVAVSVGGLLLGANVASADSVWVQSYQRGSASEACVAQMGETPWQASWGADSSWTPSWEQWANGGSGGWTCTRSINWAQTPVASGSSGVTYALGDVGPGGGLVFLISGGLTYEMAPYIWGAGEFNYNTSITWCVNKTTSVSTGTGVGTGKANTAAMAASSACSSNAAAAVLAYAPAGTNAGDWFLPSKDELNEMCNYSRNPTTPPIGACTGAQDSVFAISAYGFASDYLWSSSQYDTREAWIHRLTASYSGSDGKAFSMFVRPVRAF